MIFVVVCLDKVRYYKQQLYALLEGGGVKEGLLFQVKCWAAFEHPTDRHSYSFACL